MFVRIKTSKNSPKKAVQIVESFRTGTKVKQRIVRHVGTAFDDSEVKKLREVAEFIKAKLETVAQPTLFTPETLTELAIAARNKEPNQEIQNVNITDLREEQRIILGIHEIYGKVFDELGFNNLVSRRKVAAQRNLFHTVMARIANPASKRHSVLDLAARFGVDLSLSAVYRMMDSLDSEIIEKIKKRACQTANSLLNGKIQVAFYDCTTLYFESFTEGDELLKNGYSKDMKFNQPQVMLALLTTTDGLPIGYELYPGNTFEGNTLVDAIQRLQKNYEICRVVFVADSAMLSQKNIELLEEQGVEYIVGARLKSMSTKKQNEILAEDTWINTDDSVDDVSKYKEMKLSNNRRLIVSYNPARARKDSRDRNTTIDKLLKKIKRSKDPLSLVSNYGYKKFIKVEGKTEIYLDEEKIAQTAQWDGIHGIISNVQSMEPSQLRAQYRCLWEIEECFRISKHDLKFRPIFHWTENRVKSHVAICFIALVCVRYLQYQLRAQGLAVSVKKTVRELLSVQASIVRDTKTKKRYLIPSQITELGHKIYRKCNKKYSQVPCLLK